MLVLFRGTLLKYQGKCIDIHELEGQAQIRKQRESGCCDLGAVESDGFDDYASQQKQSFDRCESERRLR